MPNCIRHTRCLYFFNVEDELLDERTTSLCEAIFERLQKRAKEKTIISSAYNFLRGITKENEIVRGWITKNPLEWQWIETIVASSPEHSDLDTDDQEDIEDD